MPIHALIKLGERQHMEDLVARGHLYMNPVSYFVGLEGGTSRSDIYEGSAWCKDARGGLLQGQGGEEWLTVGTIAGSVSFGDDDLRRANIYCMHARRSYGLLNLHELNFGDTYAMFLDPHEFLRRLADAAAKAGRELRHDLVEYLPRNHSGPMGWFRKFDEHVAQSEFRIVLPDGDGLPFSLYLGELRDIAIIGATSEHLKLAPKTVEGEGHEADESRTPATGQPVLDPGEPLPG
jgi:hypothetical protein